MKRSNVLPLLGTLALAAALVLPGPRPAGANPPTPAPVVYYEVTDLGTIEHATGYSRAYGINDAGQVVGEASSPDGLRAFLWLPEAAYGRGAGMHNLETLGDVSGESRARAINDLGQVVGQSSAPGGSHAFRWQPGNSAAEDEIDDLGTPGYTSIAFAINNAGKVAGMAAARAAVWQPGSVTPTQLLSYQSAYASDAKGINNAGHIVGWAGGYLRFPNDTGQVIATRWPSDTAPHTPTNVGTVINSFAHAINEAGIVVGDAQFVIDATQNPPLTQQRATRWVGEVATNLGALDGATGPSFAYAINASGMIVGSAASNEGFSAFLWKGGSTLIKLDDRITDTRWDLTEARGINASGQIVGTGRFRESPGQLPVTRAFLLTPVPLSFTGPLSVNEGEVARLAFNTPPTAGFLYAYDCTGDGTFEQSDTPAASYECLYLDNGGVTADAGAFRARGRFTDSDGVSAELTTLVSVFNLAPVVEEISATVSQDKQVTTVFANANFADPGVLDTHTAVWDWGDGITSEGSLIETDGSGSVSGDHTYTAPGTYKVVLTVTDKDAASSQSLLTIEVGAVQP